MRTWARTRKRGHGPHQFGFVFQNLVDPAEMIVNHRDIAENLDLSGIAVAHDDVECVRISRAIRERAGVVIDPRPQQIRPATRTGGGQV